VACRRPSLSSFTPRQLLQVAERVRESFGGDGGLDIGRLRLHGFVATTGTRPARWSCRLSAHSIGAGLAGILRGQRFRRLADTDLPNGFNGVEQLLRAATHHRLTLVYDAAGLLSRREIAYRLARNETKPSALTWAVAGASLAWEVGSEMSNIFDLVAAGDLSAIEAVIAADPGLLAARHPSGASPIAWSAYMGKPEIAARLAAAKGAIDPFEAIILGDLDALEGISRRPSGTEHAVAGRLPAAGAGGAVRPSAAVSSVSCHSPAISIDAPTTRGRVAATMQCGGGLEAIADGGSASARRCRPERHPANGFRPVHTAAQHGVRGDDGAPAAVRRRPLRPIRRWWRCRPCRKGRTHLAGAAAQGMKRRGAEARAHRQADGAASTLSGSINLRRCAMACGRLLRLQRERGCKAHSRGKGRSPTTHECGDKGHDRVGKSASPKPHDPKAVGPRLWCKQPLPEAKLRYRTEIACFGDQANLLGQGGRPIARRLAHVPSGTPGALPNAYFLSTGRHRRLFYGVGAPTLRAYRI